MSTKTNIVDDRIIILPADETITQNAMKAYDDARDKLHAYDETEAQLLDEQSDPDPRVAALAGAALEIVEQRRSNARRVLEIREKALNDLDVDPTTVALPVARALVGLVEADVTIEVCAAPSGRTGPKIEADQAPLLRVVQHKDNPGGGADISIVYAVDRRWEELAVDRVHAAMERGEVYTMDASNPQSGVREERDGIKVQVITADAAHRPGLAARKVDDHLALGRVTAEDMRDPNYLAAIEQRHRDRVMGHNSIWAN